jgi:phage terminase small subunit
MKPKKPSVGRGVGRSAAAMAEREKAFIEAYIANGGDGANAARAAGYADVGAKRRAVTLLKRPNVIKALAERREKLARKYELTSDAVIAELSKIVHADPRKLFDPKGGLLPINEWPDDMAAAVASVEVEELFDGRGPGRKHIGYTKKVKLWDKNSGIEKAMRYLGSFERDNRQKAGMFDGVPRDVLALIEGKLREIAGMAEPADTGSSSRFTH